MNINLDWDLSVIDSKVIQESQAKTQKATVVTNVSISLEYERLN